MELLQRAAESLAEIDRTDGLLDRHADVLAALRIRLEGGPRKSLDELIKTTGDITGKRSLDDALLAHPKKPATDLGNLLSQEPKKKKSLDDLL